MDFCFLRRLGVLTPQHKVREFIRPKTWERFEKNVQCDAEIAADVKKHGGIATLVDKEVERLLSEVSLSYGFLVCV